MKTKKKNLKSFSPYINKKIDVTSLKTRKIKTINVCDNLLKIDIGESSNQKCLDYNNKNVIKFLLKNLEASKHLDVSKLIPPKQIHSNCWFNTMFVTFFFSDKGRKYFRFFRNLMITGKKYDKTAIEDIELRKLFFMLNIFIEASYNQSSNNSKHNLINKINNITNGLNTNFFIKKIYDRINNKISRSLPNIDDAGNPLEYYKRIFKYLNYNVLNILNLNIFYKNSEKELYKLIDKNFNNNEIIIIEDHNSESFYNKKYKFERNNNIYNYELDSIILTNKDHYDENANSHFVSVLTINKKEYKFDGSSYSKLTRFNWKNMINKNIDWKFRENPNYYPELYNFTKGYKLLFYYRV